MQITNLVAGQPGSTMNTRIVGDSKGAFDVIEYTRDASVGPWNAVAEYYMGQMGVRRRQLCCQLTGKNKITIQAGAMHWMVGNIQMISGIKGVANFIGKSVKGKLTGEAAAMPEYTGTGLILTEPTYKYLLLEDLSRWPGGMVVEDGMFYACDDQCHPSVVHRKSVSSAVAGGEGLFNMCLKGNGVAALESNVPREELIEVDIDNGEELKVDGHFAIAWSADLQFTVERSAKSLIGSAMSGEGLVNVYRGRGKVLLAPVTPSSSLFAATNS